MVPGAQGVGTVEPVAHAEPAGQSVQSPAWMRLVAAEKLPASHGRGVMVPAGQYFPASHGSGVVVACLGHLNPAGQRPAQLGLPWKVAFDVPR